MSTVLIAFKLQATILVVFKPDWYHCFRSRSSEDNVIGGGGGGKLPDSLFPTFSYCSLP